MSSPTGNSKVILVTGANRGIGFAIVKSLANHFQSTPSSTTILLGCRSIEAGERACTELRDQDMTCVEALQLDLTSDMSIRAAVEKIEHTYGHLDVLINNAGYAAFPSDDLSDLRQVFQDVYNVNVTAVALLTSLLLPLLRRSTLGSKVIQIGSARGSLHLNATNKLPPTASMAYSVSKTALNMLTLDMARQKENKDVEFQIASPGYCKTAFNGYRGTRDPEEGANVVVELVIGKRRDTKIRETAGSSKELIVVPW